MNNATTYTESKDRAPFDWRDFLKRAQAGEITHSENMKAEWLAGSWVTCACGVQCHAIPRNFRGEPQDIRLADLGIYFLSRINMEDWGKASEILDSIEKRSAEILASL